MPNWNSWTSPVTTPTGGDVDDQQGAEEPRQPQVLGVALAVPQGLEDGGWNASPIVSGTVEVVESGGGRLQPRQVDRRHPPASLEVQAPLFAMEPRIGPGGITPPMG